MERLENLVAEGNVRYNATTLEEMDLGDFALQISSYTAYDKNGTFSDSGT